MTSIAANGVQFNVEVSGSGPPLLLLHGFTGSSKTWARHIPSWPEFTSIAVDLLGHGASDRPADPARYRMERCVDDLTAVLSELGIQRTAVLGYSMGGRVALHFALAAPERLSALVLESASPGIDDRAERERRVASDADLADRIERDGVEAFVDRWEALPLFASQARLPNDTRRELRQQRLSNDAAGLANSLRGLGAGSQEPVFKRLGELHTPVYLITGDLDEKYCSLAGQMEQVLPCARSEIVADAGHAVHLEQPALFADAVRRFLERTHTESTKSEDI